MHRILFVDDEPTILKSLQRMVRSHSLEVETEAATSVDAALERINLGGIDVVVSDVRMPGRDGIELLTRLKGNSVTQNIPVIMLTGDGDSTVKNVAIELGAVEFINKPADPTELLARLRNVMRLKSYQDQLLSQNNILTAQLIEAQKMEIAGILASQAAHDLNNILDAILGNTELAPYKTQDQNVQGELRRVVDAAQHAGRLLRQISNLGRHDHKAAHISDPCLVIEECLDLLRLIVPQDITVEWVNPHLSVSTGVEATAMHQVVMNLVINAVHAMGTSGFLSLKVYKKEFSLDEVAEKGVAPGCYVVVSVCDTGCGIDEAVRPHIFEPFFTTKDADKGTGIGLSVVDRIVCDQGGFVEVVSSVEGGTTFSVHLPVLETAKGQPATVAVSADLH